MPGILLYCNGMKPKFKIKLQYDKKNNIWAAIAIILVYPPDAAGKSARQEDT